jgi:aryl-alcohol dehydrogenase-like predicted oxidoreductase
MEYRTFGGTGLKVSVLGFGASPLGDVFEKSDPTELKRAAHFACDQGINLFDVSPYYGLTLAEQRLGEALVGKRRQVVLSTKCDMDRVLLPVAKRYGIAVLNAAPLHMGLLTEAGAPAWHPAPPAVQQAGRRVAEWCRQKGVDVSALALRFCLDHAYVSSTLVGMASADCVRRNLEQLCLTTDQELVAEVRSALGEAFNFVWPSGRAENHDV